MGKPTNASSNARRHSAALDSGASFLAVEEAAAWAPVDRFGCIVEVPGESAMLLLLTSDAGR